MTAVPTAPVQSHTQPAPGSTSGGSQRRPAAPHPKPTAAGAAAAPSSSQAAGAAESAPVGDDAVSEPMLAQLRTTMERATALQNEQDGWQTPDDAHIAAAFVREHDHLQSALRRFQAAAARVRFQSATERVHRQVSIGAPSFVIVDSSTRFFAAAISRV